MRRICLWCPTSARRPTARASAWPTWRSTTCSRRSDSRLLAEDLDHQPLVAAAVELDVEDRLPRAEVEPPLGDGHDHLVVHEQVLQVRVPVVLAAAVVAVVAGVRQQLARGVVRRFLPARRRELVEPLERVLL